MKKNNSCLEKILCVAVAVAGLTLLTHQASAQTIVAKWTFETLPSNLSYKPGAAVATTNYLADIGGGTASGQHAAAVATYSSPAGNGSARSLSANTWGVGDYYQFIVNTTGFTNIAVSFDQVGSATGPRDFTVTYSTDGVNFTQFGEVYAVLSSPSWSAGAPVTGESYLVDLSAVTSLTDAPVVYFRLVDNSTTAINGSPVGTGGTDRVDNFAVLGTIAGPPQIITQPADQTSFFGDTAVFNVIAGGDAPLTYQWYTNSTPLTPLSDGGSGFGPGTINGSATPTLTLTAVSTNQTGDYRVVIMNNLNSITSSVVHLAVIARPLIATNIAYLHTLHDANYALNDTTNIYQIDGVVTTVGNLVSGTTEVESFYVQDGTGGVDVFYRGGFSFPETGDHVRITAPLDQFNGGLEMAPINGNPAHTIEILGSGTVPDPQVFDFTTPAAAIVMEHTNEGLYMVVSNVFIGVTNTVVSGGVTNVDPRLVGNEIIFMTNLTGQVFHMIVANNPVLQPPGNALPGPFATAVRGVMTQVQTSGTVFTNGYSLILSDFSQIDIGTPPPPPLVPSPDTLHISVSDGQIHLTWTNPIFTLQSSTNAAGPYTDVPDASGTAHITSATDGTLFFRLHYATP